MEEQTYFVRVNRREPVSGVIFDCEEQDGLTKGQVLSLLRDFYLIEMSSTLSLQLWDNVKEDWIDPRQFYEDNL